MGEKINCANWMEERLSVVLIMAMYGLWQDWIDYFPGLDAVDQGRQDNSVE